ncbi:MAG TPA: pseudouridine synthase [Bacteroidetes bacterium]|nr:pseudouridine synthase [Bacteroidota bacterium]
MVALGYLFIIVILSYVIWATSESFEQASSYLGRNMAPGVRGATINAIGSSMPELLTTIFFLSIAGNEEGFAGGFGTMVGSAIFNLLVIPSAVLITMMYTKQKTDTLYSPSTQKSLWRDVIFLLAAQGLLLILVKPTMYWWNGLLLMLFYGLYLWFLLGRKGQRQDEMNQAIANIEEEKVHDIETKERSILSNIVRLDIYSLFTQKKAIDVIRAWMILAIALLLMGTSCLFLVYLCEELGALLNIPIIVIALVIAASATSVPDLFISVRAAKKGNTADALSNALGSNIFDLCFALGLPMFLYILFSDQGVLNAFEHKEEWAFSVMLRWVMIILTLPAFLVLIIPKLNIKQKSSLLLILYSLFVFLVFSYVKEFDVLQQILQEIMATDVAQGLL